MGRVVEVCLEEIDGAAVSEPPEILLLLLPAGVDRVGRWARRDPARRLRIVSRRRMTIIVAAVAAAKVNVSNQPPAIARMARTPLTARSASNVTAKRCFTCFRSRRSVDRAFLAKVSQT